MANTDKLLTSKDIATITGYIQPARQCKALSERGIPFTKDRNGNPVLSWAVFNNVLLGIKQETQDESGFNLSAI